MSISASAIGLAILGITANVSSGWSEESDREVYERFFNELRIAKLQIAIDDAGIESLRRDPRRYVNATLHDVSKVYTDVAIHLKGSAGSFQPVDRKPALTINMDKFKDDQRFYGMDKWPKIENWRR